MRDKHLTSKFWVIGTYFNPPRFKTRERLANEFIARMNADPNINLFIVETAFGDREFHLTQPNNPRHLQLRTYDELWHKESTINLAVQRLPSDWEYVAWIDMDVQFVRPDWQLETAHQLQHHQIVQMWQDANHLGPNMEITNDWQIKSFAYLYKTGQMLKTPAGYPYSGQGGKKAAYPHPGFAWAMRREAWEAVGGLLDICILGAGDYHMAHSLVGRAQETLEWNPEQKSGYHPNYRQMIMNWAQHAEHFLKRDLGYVPGTILHHWHGRQTDRKYNERWRTLVNHKFDPLMDLRRDSQGLYQLNPLKWELRDALRNYASARNEDSIDVF